MLHQNLVLRIYMQIGKVGVTFFGECVRVVWRVCVWRWPRGPEIVLFDRICSRGINSIELIISSIELIPQQLIRFKSGHSSLNNLHILNNLNLLNGHPGAEGGRDLGLNNLSSFKDTV